MSRTKNSLASLAVLVAALGSAGCGRNAGAERAGERVSEVPAAPSSQAQRAEDLRTARLLRAKGPDGLAAVLATHDAVAREPPSPARERELARLRELIAKVAGQRDAHVSRLYWYTELTLARRVARAAGKPILSLRMLGRLDEELSCANSRFFRIALYANASLSRFLADNFILHWSSERPVPRITVDFGDGRKLERTIAGNSVHYVLDSEARPVDALPGLYGPAGFRRMLELALPLARDSAKLGAEAQRKLVVPHHQARYQVLAQDWRTSVFSFQGQPGALPSIASVSERRGAGSALGERRREFPLRLAERTTVTKSGIELRLSDEFRLGAAIGSVPDEAPFWLEQAKTHAADGLLDPQSRELIRAKAPSDWAASPSALGGPALTSAIEDLERKLAADGLLAEYRMHHRIHSWFIDRGSGGKRDLGTLNDWMYSEIFLTPKADPWLGMADRAISGLPGDGVLGPAPAPAPSATPALLSAKN